MRLRAVRLPVLCFVMMRAVSTLGSMAAGLAVLIWVKQLTGSNSAAALSMLLFALPSLVYPLIGELVDTYDRVTLLIIGQLTGALLTSGFLVVHGASDVWLVYVLQFLQGVTTGLIAVSSDAVLPRIARKEELAATNGFMQSSNQIARLLAPTIGVLCYTRFGGIEAVVVLDVTSFAVGVALLMPVARASHAHGGTSKKDMAAANGRSRHKPIGARRAWTGYLRVTRQGIALITGDPGVRLMVMTAGFCILAVGLLSSVWYAVITAGLGQPASFAGVLATAQAAGGVAGGVAGAWFAKRTGRARPGCRIALVLIGLAALSFLSGRPVLAAAGSAAVGFGGTVLVVVYATLIQSSVAGESLGKVFAGMDALINLMQVGGLAFGAIWLAVASTAFEPLVVLAALIAFAGLALTLRTRVPRPAAADMDVPATSDITS